MKIQFGGKSKLTPAQELHLIMSTVAEGTSLKGNRDLQAAKALEQIVSGLKSYLFDSKQTFYSGQNPITRQLVLNELNDIEKALSSSCFETQTRVYDEIRTYGALSSARIAKSRVKPAQKEVAAEDTSSKVVSFEKAVANAEPKKQKPQERRGLTPEEATLLMTARNAGARNPDGTEIDWAELGL